jgi:hypothetical protein
MNRCAHCPRFYPIYVRRIVDLHIVWSSICQLHENWCRGLCVCLTDVNYITFPRVLWNWSKVKNSLLLRRRSALFEVTLRIINTKWTNWRLGSIKQCTNSVTQRETHWLAAAGGTGSVLLLRALSCAVVFTRCGCAVGSYVYKCRCSHRSVCFDEVSG